MKMESNSNRKSAQSLIKAIKRKTNRTVCVQTKVCDYVIKHTKFSL